MGLNLLAILFVEFILVVHCLCAGKVRAMATSQINFGKGIKGPGEGVDFGFEVEVHHVCNEVSISALGVLVGAKVVDVEHVQRPLVFLSPQHTQH